MFRKILTSCLTLCALTGIAQAAVLDRVPDEFTVTQRWFSWTTDFDIETKNFKLGYVHRKFFSLALEYDFYDMDDSLLAKARMRWFSWGATFDVVDDLELPLGRVEEKIFTFFPTFEIISPANEILAIAKLNFWGTTYTLRDPVTSEPLATLYRPFFRLKDNWTVNIVNTELFYQKQIDPRLFVILMAFQTDRDMWDAEQRNHDNNYNRSIYTANYIEEDEEEPSEEDFQKIDALTTEILTNAPEDEINNEKERIQKGMNLLEPLLNSEELTPKEKKALSYLLEEKATR